MVEIGKDSSGRGPWWSVRSVRGVPPDCLLFVASADQPGHPEYQIWMESRALGLTNQAKGSNNFALLYELFLQIFLPFRLREAQDFHPMWMLSKIK